MKINIFGVGRSGTKAIQLYLAYLIARKEGRVWINYEPYYWKDRRTLNLNYEGIYNHINTPLIINNTNRMNEEQINFLSKLTSYRGSIVTKFIRANGRIEAINKITQPDFSVIIIRDLFEVINSLSKFEWDFLGQNLIYGNEWERLITEVREKEIIKEDDLNYYLKHIKDQRDKNAFYWYIMNFCALNYNNNDGKVYYIEYNHINNIKKICEKEGLFARGLSIRDNIFKGSNIHGDYPLIECSSEIEETLFLPSIGSLNHINTKLDILNSYNMKNKNNINFNKEKKNILRKEIYNLFYKEIYDLLTLKKQNLDINKDKKNNKKESYNLQIKKNKIVDNSILLKKLEVLLDEYKYFISPELIYYLLNVNNEKVIVLGSDDRINIVSDFIKEFSNILKKNIVIDDRIRINLKSLERFKLSSNQLESVDKIIVVTNYEEFLFRFFLQWAIKPNKVIFSNRRYSRKSINFEKMERGFDYVSLINMLDYNFTPEFELFIKEAHNTRVIIFGAGGTGKDAYECIEHINNLINKNILIVGFMDNDQEKWEKSFLGRKIFKPTINVINQVEKVIIASMWKEDIKKQLSEIGVENKKIITFFRGVG